MIYPGVGGWVLHQLLEALMTSTALHAQFSERPWVRELREHQPHHAPLASGNRTWFAGKSKSYSIFLSWPIAMIDYRRVNSSSTFFEWKNHDVSCQFHGRMCVASQPFTWAWGPIAGGHPGKFDSTNGSRHSFFPSGQGIFIIFGHELTRLMLIELIELIGRYFENLHLDGLLMLHVDLHKQLLQRQRKTVGQVAPSVYKQHHTVGQEFSAFGCFWADVI